MVVGGDMRSFMLDITWWEYSAGYIFLRTETPKLYHAFPSQVGKDAFRDAY